MTCAKTTVICTLVLADGERVVGTNWCRNPQKYCPRKPGEGYEKCKSICDQAGHAEIVALARAGSRAAGATAYIEGHTYACHPCTSALRAYGVQAIIIGKPPAKEPDLVVFDELRYDPDWHKKIDPAMAEQAEKLGIYMEQNNITALGRIQLRR